MKKICSVMAVLLAVVLSGVLLYPGGAGAEEFRVGFGTSHFSNSSNNERVTTNIRVSNRSSLDPLTIKDVQIIERSTGTNIINLASPNCLFNADSGLPFIAPLPITLQPLGQPISSISFNTSRCLSGVPRRGPTAGGDTRDVASFVTIVTIDAKKKSQIGGSSSNTRRDNITGAFLGQTLANMVILPK